MTPPTVAIVGLGLMGGNMAARLLDHEFTVVGYDVDDDAVAAAESMGVEVAESPAGAAARADVVVTSLPNPDVVEGAYLGEDGIARSDCIAIEMSTIDPDTTQRIASEAPDLRLLDAPVSGGPESTEEGTLTIICGGPDDVFEREEVGAVFDALGDKVYHTGALGTGHTVKLLNNMLSMGNLMLAMETVALGAEAGVDGEAMLEVLTNAGGSSNQLEKRFPRVLNRNFEPGFSVDYAKKDTGLAVETAGNRDVPMAIGSLVHQLYVRASAEGLGGEDASSVVKLFEQSTGTDVEANREVDESYGGY